MKPQPAIEPPHRRRVRPIDRITPKSTDWRHTRMLANPSARLTVVALAGVSMLLLAAVAAPAAVTPYVQDFDSIAGGGSLPDAIIGSASGATLNTWQVFVDGSSNHWYQNTLTTGKGFSSLQFADLGGTVAPSKEFYASAVVDPVSVPNAVNYTAGIRFLADTATSTDNSFVADLNIGSNAGRMRIVEFTGSSAGVYPSTAQASQPLVPNFDLSKTYLLEVAGSYDVTNALTVTFKVSEVGNPANFQSYTYSADATPRTGQYFGLYDSMGSGGGTMVVNYDNLTVLPEPATMALLALGGLALIRRRRA